MARARAPAWRAEVLVPESTVEAYTRALETGCGAVSWEVAGPRGTVRLLGFADGEPDRARLEALLELVAAARGMEAPALGLTMLGRRDWVAENQRRFPPLEVGRYFIHRPHHRIAVPAGRVGILLGAGGAFGTGEHASTAGCLLALDWLARRRRFLRPLDLGCGTGILALAMAKTWAAPVVAVDVDPLAVESATENARLNGVSKLVRAVGGDGYRTAAVRARAPYDLIVANLYASPLRRLSAGLARHLDRRGVAVLSGLLARESMAVLSAHRRHRMGLRRRFDIDGWHTLVLGR